MSKKTVSNYFIKKVYEVMSNHQKEFKKSKESGEYDMKSSNHLHTNTLIIALEYDKFTNYEVDKILFTKGDPLALVGMIETSIERLLTLKETLLDKINNDAPVMTDEIMNNNNEDSQKDLVGDILKKLDKNVSGELKPEQIEKLKQLVKEKFKDKVDNDSTLFAAIISAEERTKIDKLHEDLESKKNLGELTDEYKKEWKNKALDLFLELVSKNLENEELKRIQELVTKLRNDPKFDCEHLFLRKLI